ncbi:hypothetical protein IFM89_019763, partial [Coptis chinensis]
MALSLSHQIGSLSGKPITSSETADPTASLNAAAIWKPPTSSNLRCRVQKQGGDVLDSLSSPPVSPCRSPSIRPDLNVACQALVAERTEFETSLEEKMITIKEHKEGSSGKDKGKGGVPVYVMMPLDSVTMGNGVNRKKAMNASLQALKSAGVQGIMMDVWWGLVERDGPGVYNWGGYNELMEMAKKHGLKVQAVMSFHQCGGNVGDSVSIPLPKWATEEIDKDPDLAYTDQWGRRNYEYISLGCDTLPVLKGRTPVQCYADFMRSFRDNFKHLLGDTIVEIQVGMGPAGSSDIPHTLSRMGPGNSLELELSSVMTSSLKAAAEASGNPKWGSSGPTDAGHYNNWPEDTQFFRRENGGWDSPYGKFFLSWYSQMLLDHGERILSSVQSIFEATGVKISVKVAGIHWHYGTRSHAPELTAGYYNTRTHDGYIPIAEMLARYGAIFNFTCIEMRDHEQPQDALCAPEKLVRQVALATRGLVFHLQVKMHCHDLFQADNWRKFVSFVKRMKEGRGKEVLGTSRTRGRTICAHNSTPGTRGCCCFDALVE